MISFWPWGLIKHLQSEKLRNHSAIRGWSGRVEEQSAIIRNLADELEQMEMSRDAYRQVGQELKGQRDWFQQFAQHWSNLEHIHRGHLVPLDRSRRGWKWLYEQKCEQWQYLAGQIHWVDDLYADTFQRLTEALGLRDGWEQTARENESEIVALMGQVKQSDSNTQRVEAERDEALQAVDHLREDRDRLQRRVDLQHSAIGLLEAEWDALQGLHNDALLWVSEKDEQGKIKDATIERLEAEAKRLGANDQRDSRGRFTSS